MPDKSTVSEKQKILIVDDSTQNIKVLNQILKSDYVITVATNGESALSRLDSPDDLPDIILLDIIMPGLDGYEVCRKIKANSNTCDIPVIFITAKDEIEDEEKGFNVGAVDYITKPVSPAIVRARVKTHLLIKNQQDLLKESIAILKHRAERLQKLLNDIAKTVSELH